jgi:hypothetical protein
MGGQLRILMWLGENNYPWDTRLGDWGVHDGESFTMTCRGAAAFGQLEVLKWLRQNECPWDWSVTAIAAEAGHLEALKWLRSHGCPWNEQAGIKAANHGRGEVLEWIKANGGPGAALLTVSPDVLYPEHDWYNDED